MTALRKEKILLNGSKLSLWSYLIQLPLKFCLGTEKQASDYKEFWELSKLAGLSKHIVKSNVLGFLRSQLSRKLSQIRRLIGSLIVSWIFLPFFNLIGGLNAFSSLNEIIEHQSFFKLSEWLLLI